MLPYVDHKMSEEEDSSINLQFEKAAEHLKALVGDLDSKKLLYFYARFKQVKEGPCSTPKPGFFDFNGKQKWEAWKSLGNKSKEAAMREYVEMMMDTDPEWESKVDSSSSRKQGGVGGVVVSCMYNSEKQLPDDQKTIFDWCKEGNTDTVNKLLAKNRSEVNCKDEEGMALLHWASDRGHKDLVECLLNRHKADINVQDASGQTALHYAASCDYIEIVQLLVKFKANTDVMDSDGQKASELCENRDIRALLDMR